MAYTGVIELLLKSKSEIENKIRVVEELGELQKEILKDLRGQLNRKNLLEEMADTYIEFEMTKLIYGVTDEELKEYVGDKLVRNLLRLQNEK